MYRSRSQDLPMYSVLMFVIKCLLWKVLQIHMVHDQFILKLLLNCSNISNQQAHFLNLVCRQIKIDQQI